MVAERQVVFGAFRLDLADKRLWRERKALRLSPKAFSVLQHLAGRPDRLVTQDQIFAAVWPEVVVSDAALTICIQELRKVLGERAKAPRYIETVPKRGYRWIAPLSSTPTPHGAWIVEREASPPTSSVLRSLLDA